MATLGELQEQLAALKERYSAVVEGSYSYEADIATIAVNMQAQLDDAQAAASSAGTYAAIAENAADEAAVAGAAAGATAGTEAGTSAGTAAAQAVYDNVFTQEHTYTDTQNFSDITIQGEGPITAEQAAWLMKNAPAGDYKADSYFTNLWADKRTDDIYVRRIYKFAYNTAPEITPLSDSLPEKVTLTLKTGAIRVYDNALAALFATTSGSTPQYRSKIAVQTIDACYDPVLEHTLLGFWDRCNYYKDENGDTRIVAVRGEEGFDKRKPDVGTFGPAIWFDVRDSLDVDTNGNPKYTEVIVSTAPHPELGLHPHPLAMRHDGTVAPYWCCSAYPASLSSTGELVSVYNGYPDLSIHGGYGQETLAVQYMFDKCREKSGKGYGDGSYIVSLLQLIHIIKYGTKNSQAILPGAYNNIYSHSIPTMATDSVGAQALGYNAAVGAHWVPVEDTESNRYLLTKCNTVWVDGTGTGIYTAPTSDETKPYMITHIDTADSGLRVWLETDYSIILTSAAPLYIAKSMAGCTDNVYSKYDGVAMYSACTALLPSVADKSYSYQPFRLHGIEYGLQGEVYMDKVWMTDIGTTNMRENGTQGYYRLPWENKYADTTTAPVHTQTEKYVSYYYYGTDYTTRVIAENYAESGYDVVISVPECTAKTGTDNTGLCDMYATADAGSNLYATNGWGGSNLVAGLFFYNATNLTYSWWSLGARL